jgi:diguanylate cyclase
MEMEKGGGKHPKALTEPDNALEKYAKEILETMIRNGVPPTPSNFATYFDKELDERPSAFRKKVLTILEMEEDDESREGLLEQTIKEAFEYVKKLMLQISHIYKNLRHLEKVTQKRALEAKAIADKKVLLSFLDTLNRDIATMRNIIKKDAESIKEQYEATSILVSEAETHAIHDDAYGVFRKNYFLKKMAQEEKLIKEFGHESTLMMVKASDALIKSVESSKVQHLIRRTVARLLMKTSRRSDIVAHYGHGVFAILMRHTSLTSAKMAAERLKDLVGNTNFFVGDREIILDVDIAIARIDLNRSMEQTITCALETLESVDDEKHAPCGVCPQDMEI